MKYSTRQYARALYESLRHASEKEQKEIMKRFYTMLSRQRALFLYERIMKETERLFFSNSNTRKVLLESPSGLSDAIKKEVRQRIGGNVVIEEKIVPELLAGIRIRVDDDVLIDASAKRQIMRLFI